jgi:ubiquinone/menaquinone biosynthesis C-methylase UbiE
MHTPATDRALLQAAARARIDRLTEGVIDDMSSHRTAVSNVWGLGDYHRFAKETVWGLGPRLVAACGIGPGQRVLDVGAGSGNIALRAAQAGAVVVASDLTPENLEAGRLEAGRLGVELDWVEADAERLPFEDAAFDAVTSSFGVMFASDHERAAHELLRVCRPGGVVGVLSFTPDGLGGRFFGLLAPYLPPPPAGALTPLLWGEERHVQELFGDHVESLETTRSTYVERAETPASYCRLFKETFGPVVALYASLVDDPERLEALDRDFLRYAVDENTGRADGPAEYEYEYLLVVARKRT